MAISDKKIKEVKNEYETTKTPVLEIARKHGISRSSLLSWVKKFKWKGRPKQKKTPKVKSKGGRPEKYKSEYCEQATQLCMLGYSDIRLASFFNIVESTFYEWKLKYAEFSEALKEGRENANLKVAASLFERACGYSHEEEKIFFDKDALSSPAEALGMGGAEKEKDPRIIRAKTIKHYPPETKAIAMWLKNKEPDLWKDKQEVDLVDRTLRTVLPAVEQSETEDDFMNEVKKEIGQ